MVVTFCPRAEKERVAFLDTDGKDGDNALTFVNILPGTLASVQRPPLPQSSPSSDNTQNFRPALRVGLIAGLTLAVAAVAQQLSPSPTMRTLGMLIIVVGFSVTGLFAARESHVQQRRAGSGVGAVSGLIAGVCVSLAFIAISLILSFDSENLRALQVQVEQQLSPSQMEQLRAAAIDMTTLTQFSLGLTVTCCGLGFPLLGLLLGALGGASGATKLRTQDKK